VIREDQSRILKGGGNIIDEGEHGERFT